MKLDVEACRVAYRIVDHVASHAGLLASQFLRLSYQKKTLFLNLTGLAISGAHVTVGEEMDPWVFYLDRRVFGAFLTTAQEKTIDLTLNDKTLILKCGNQKVQVQAIAAITGYSFWKPEKTAKPWNVTEDICKELSVLSQYAPITAAADHLSAVYLVKGYGLLATDSFCLSAYLNKAISQTFPIPVTLAQLAANEKPSALYIEKQGAGMKYPKGYIYESVPARCLTDYPLDDVRKVIDSVFSIRPTFVVSSQQLLEGLNYIKNYIFGSDLDVVVKVDSVKSGMTISMDSPQGQVLNKLPGKTGAAEFSIQWPVAKVYPWAQHLAAVGDIEISCGLRDDGSRVLVTTDRVLIIR